MDGISVQHGTINWRDAGTATGTPVNLYFLFDAVWGHNQVGSVNHSMRRALCRRGALTPRVTSGAAHASRG